MSRQVVTPTVTTDISCFNVALYAPTALVEPIRDVRCKFLHAVSICRYLGKHTINAIVAHVARVTQRRLSTHTPPMGHARIQVLVLFFGSLLLACLHFCALQFRPHNPSSSAQDTVLFRDAVVSWWRFLLLPLIVLIMQPVVVRPPSSGKQPRTSS